MQLVNAKTPSVFQQLLVTSLLKYTAILDPNITVAFIQASLKPEFKNFTAYCIKGKRNQRDVTVLLGKLLEY